MKRTLIALSGLLTAVMAHGAVAELNVNDGTIESLDGMFIGRDFTVVDGFKLELLYVTDTDAEGQWVALGWDNEHRLVVPSYNSSRMARLTIPNVGSDDPLQIEMITSAPVAAAEGVLYAFDSLYYNANRNGNAGVYRMRDLDGDGTYDETRVIRNRVGDGNDHGTHTLQLTPDRGMISVISGNATRLTDYNRSRVPEVWGEDNLVMRMDLSPPGFHRAPEAHIFNFNADGSDWELWSIGMRNPVSHAYNKDGELFVYDADEEPNMGFTVGYRPTDIIHATSGSDAGWRSGSKVHPFYQFDFHAPIGVVGSGSPVGSAFGTGTKFPADYQDAFFIADWSFGNLWATFITPDGSSYKAEAMPFVSGRPFAVSGIIPNTADGSLIVMTTGTQLYRVTYVGDESTAPTFPDMRYADMRNIRHNIERYHGVQDPAAVDFVWPYLKDQDRSIRYAARTALEWQDVATWRDRALNELDPRTAIAAIASLARVSARDEYHTAPGSPPKDKALEARMLAALDRIEWDRLPFQDKLDYLRAYQLTMIRLGQPSQADANRIIAKLDPHLPSQYQELNRELSEILIYLQAPTAATKVMALLRDAPDNPYYGIQEWINPQQRQRQDRGDVEGPNNGISQQTLARQDAEIFYAQLLRTLTNGWTPELRREYMEYFTTAPARYYGTTNGLTNIRIDAISQIPEAERAALQDLIDTPMPTGFGRGGRGGGGGPGGPQAAAPGGAAAPAAAAGRGGFGGGGRGSSGTPGLGAPAENLYITGTGRGGGLSDIGITQATRFNEELQPQLAAQTAASNALTQAAFSLPANAADIRARADALAEAELQLALARADRYSEVRDRMQSDPEQQELLIQRLSGQGGGGRGRGGGFGF